MFFESDFVKLDKRYGMKGTVKKVQSIRSFFFESANDDNK